MNPIVINYIPNKTSDQLDDKDLIEGDTIRILWGNGTFSIHTILVETRIEKNDPVFTLIKSTGTAFYRKSMDVEIKRAFINLGYNSSYIKVFLNECQNVLCERVIEGL